MIETKREMTVVLDNELSETWAKIHNVRHVSFVEFLKESLAKETLKYSVSYITESVKNISGSLDTSQDYKELRDDMIEEQLQDYENLR